MPRVPHACSNDLQYIVGRVAHRRVVLYTYSDCITEQIQVVAPAPGPGDAGKYNMRVPAAAAAAAAGLSIRYRYHTYRYRHRHLRDPIQPTDDGKRRSTSTGKCHPPCHDRLLGTRRHQTGNHLVIPSKPARCTIRPCIVGVEMTTKKPLAVISQCTAIKVLRPWHPYPYPYLSLTNWKTWPPARPSPIFR